MTGRLLLSTLLLAGTLRARAEDHPATLDETKQELKVLQNDRAGNQTGGTSDSLKAALPQFQTPAAGQPELPMQLNPKADKKRRQQDSQKNWLVDGVEQLSKKSSAKDKDKNISLKEDEGEKKNVDLSESDYLLRIYGEQGSKDELSTASSTDRRPATVPLAPFLQGWLAGSPVRGKFFDEFLRRPPATTGVGREASASAGNWESALNTGLAGSENTSLLSATPSSAAAPQNNPYLQSLQLPAFWDSLPGGGNAGLPPVGTVNLGHSPTSGIAPALPTDKPADPGRKPLVPPALDDRKYFPQLKRF